MRNLTLCTVLLSLVASAACAPPAAQEGTELTALSDAWEEALNGGDIDALSALYTDDARVLPPGAEMQQGQEAVRAAFGAMIDAGLSGQLDTVEATVAGDVGYRVGTFSIMTPDGAIADRGKFIEIWRRAGGQWRISSDIWNSDSAPTPSTTTLTVTHEVEDAERWLAAWRGEDSRHELFARYGAPRVRTFQSPDNPNLTGLLIEVADMEAFQAFLKSPAGEAAKTEDGVKHSTMRVLAAVE